MSAICLGGVQREAIINALERQRRHGTMIPDQTGFTATYDTVMALVPEAYKHEAGKEILQTIWKHRNNNKQSVPNQSLSAFKAWLQRNHILRLLLMNEPGQEHRYGQIVRDLQAKEANRHNTLLEFMTYTEGKLRIYSQMTPEFCKKYVTSLTRIKEARAKGESHLEATQEFKRRGEFLSSGGDVYSRGTGEPWFFTDIPQTMTLTAPVQVQVQNQLRGMSYYCGRHAGTYIFRLKQSDTVHGDFTFLGLVPRHRADHIARLKAIRGRVLHILIAACSYIAGLTGVSSEQSAPEMQARMDQATDQDLESVFRYARIYLAHGCMVRDIREAFRDSSILYEFVYLMVMCKVTPEEMKEGGLMVNLICQVAKCSEAEMVNTEEMHIEAAAWHCLFYNNDLSNCLVFHDNEVESQTGVPLNIHEYFAGDEFAVDPNHPKAQYRFTDEIWKKLENDFLFARSVHRRWTQEHPHASKLAYENRPKEDFPLLASAFLRGQAPDPLPTTYDSQPSSSRPTTEPAKEQPTPVKRGRGRPKGSNNKPKAFGPVSKPTPSAAKKRKRSSTSRNGSAMVHHAALGPSLAAAGQNLEHQAGPFDNDNTPPLVQHDTDSARTESGAAHGGQI